MRARFPADCRPVSDRFRNTLFICLAPSAAPLRCALTRGLAPGLFPLGCSAALRVHSRAGALLRLLLRLLRWAARLGCPFDCCLSARISPLDCYAPRSRLGLRPPDCPFDCSAALRAAYLSARLQRRASRRVSLRSTAALGSALAPGLAPPDCPFGCFAALRASSLSARLLRYAPRSRLGWRPADCPFGCCRAARLVSLRSTAPLSAPRSRLGLRPPDCPFGCFAALRASYLSARLLRLRSRWACAPLIALRFDCSAALRAHSRAGARLLRGLSLLPGSACVPDFTSAGPVLRWRAQRRTVFPARSIHF